VGGALLAGGVLVAGGAALDGGGVASAQSPSPSPSPSPSTRPGMPRMGQGDFAQRLAQALGIPQSRVEDALRQQREQHRTEAEARRTQHLTEAAAKLGVTAQQLQDAITAARQSVIGSMQPGQGNQGQRPPRMSGPGMGRPNSDAFYQAIARNLGRAITAQQVRDALQTGRTSMTPPDRTQIEQRMNEHLRSSPGCWA
jgi:DNA-binding transcriptional MocR family regulator